MLKANDLVKMIHSDDELLRMGFKMGNHYLVTPGAVYLGDHLTEGLVIESDKHEVIMLIDAKGDLTDYCDNFTLKTCPVTLPKGPKQ